MSRIVECRIWTCHNLTNNILNVKVCEFVCFLLNHVKTALVYSCRLDLLSESQAKQLVKASMEYDNMPNRYYTGLILILLSLGNYRHQVRDF